MKWFKHDSNASMNAKLQEVLLDYGLEGYGLYWYCLELITSKVAEDCLTFELEHDARIIARNTGSTPQRVSEMMSYFVKLGLFDQGTTGVISCIKLAKRLDKSMTSNPQMRKIIGNLKVNHDKSQKSHDPIMTDHDPIMTDPDLVMQEENRIEENRIDKNINTPNGVLGDSQASPPPDPIETNLDDHPDDEKNKNIPYQQILNLYHEILPQCPKVRVFDKKRKSQIRARWKTSPEFQSIVFWESYFRKVSESRFLMGQNGKDWIADFDFLTGTKMISAVEGKYDNREGATDAADKSNTVGYTRGDSSGDEVTDFLEARIARHYQSHAPIEREIGAGSASSHR